MITNWYQHLSIAHKLRMCFMVLAIACLVFFSEIYIYQGTTSLKASVLAETVNTANLTGSRHAASLRLNSPNFAAEALQELGRNERYNRICLYDDTGRLFTYFVQKNVRCQASIALHTNGMFEELARYENANVTVQRNIIADGILIGAILIERTQSVVTDYVREQLQLILFIGIGTLLVAYMIANRLQRHFSQRVYNVVQMAESAASSEFHQPIWHNYGDEFGKFINALNRVIERMECQLMETKSELAQEREKNQKLSENYHLTVRKLDERVDQFIDSLDGLHLFHSLIKARQLGNNVDSYISYGHDLLEGFDFCAVNMQSFIRSTKIYGESINSAPIKLDLHASLKAFCHKVTAAVPFMDCNDRQLNAFNNRQIVVHQAVWDEMLEILCNLYAVFAAYIQFSPQLSLTLTEEKVLVITLGEKFEGRYGHANKILSFKKPEPIVDRSAKNSRDFEEASDPDGLEASADFLDEEYLRAPDLYFILDSIKYLANASHIPVHYAFASKRFVITMHLTALLSNNLPASMLDSSA